MMTVMLSLIKEPSALWALWHASSSELNLEVRQQVAGDQSPSDMSGGPLINHGANACESEAIFKSEQLDISLILTFFDHINYLCNKAKTPFFT